MTSADHLIQESIRARLFVVPAHTVVHAGHGGDTTIGAERAQRAANIRRLLSKRLPGEEGVP